MLKSNMFFRLLEPVSGRPFAPSPPVAVPTFQGFRWRNHTQAKGSRHSLLYKRTLSKVSPCKIQWITLQYFVENSARPLVY